QPPQFINPPDKLYVQMGETICGEFYSADAANEQVFMSLDPLDIFPSPNSSTTSVISTPLPPTGLHQNFKYCFEFFNFNDYGEYNVPIILTDNNACNAEWTTHNLTIDVLCPSCPEILYVDYRNPSHYPFIQDATIDAASEIYVGTVDLQPGHEVNTEDHHVIFTAQDIQIGTITGTNFELIPSPGSCSQLCLDCCTPDNPITYDLPQDFPVTTITPFTTPGVNDIFYV